MKLFIDSADVEKIKEAWDWGIIDGVTTNPSRVAKAYNGPFARQLFCA
jgi:transaldolase